MTVVGETVGGVGLLARGLALIVKRPRLFLLGALPPLVTSLIFVGVLVLLVTQADVVVGWLTPFADSWDAEVRGIVRVLVGLALIAGSILLMVITFTALTLTLGGPLYDKISESVEAEFGPVPQPREESRVSSTGRSISQSIRLVAISALVALALFGSGFIPVVGQSVVPALSVSFGGWMLCLELVGSAFERRGLIRLADRRAAMRRHRGRVLAFGVPTFLLLAIPFAGVVVFPVATAAGTLLARQLLGEPTR